jgi:hypothetical protein
MKRVTVCCVSACLSVSLAAVVVAQAPALDVRMGLWEMTMTTQVGGQVPEFDTSKMTPEQKARVEESMKRMMGTRTNVTKSCMTREKFEKSAFMNDRADQNCKQALTTNTRSTLEGTLTCTGEHPRSGQLHIDALSPTSVKGVIKSANTEQGRTMNIDIVMTGKWISADCGSEK